ncbi:MAG: LicD family protein [Bacteroidales bacterium]|nr:LicD family protein [Bacteroidales bacterium]
MKDLLNHGEDSWGIRDLQNCILNIAEYLDSFCESKEIDYCLMGGSALGAVRHKGFIPWDDDLDIFMTPENYKKFREQFYEKGDKQTYYLQEWGSKDGKPSFAKLRLNKSHYVEPNLDSLKIHKGVFVDIFILHVCPDNRLSHLWQYFWSRYLVVKSLANRNYSRRGLIANLILKPLKLLPKRAFVKYALKQIYSNSATNSKYLCHYLGRAGYKKGLYNRVQFSSTIKVPFETIALRVPSGVEDYLHSRWGDYMKLPSEEDIRYYQHTSHWDINTYFDGYSQDGYYPDEKNLIV